MLKYPNVRYSVISPLQVSALLAMNELGIDGPITENNVDSIMSIIRKQGILRIADQRLGDITQSMRDTLREELQNPDLFPI